MTKKLLHQVRWMGGQTDGDPVEGTVRRILNMEMDDFGRLTTREPLTKHSSVTAIGGGSAAFLSYSPSWSTADSWVAVVRSHSVYMMPVINGVVSLGGLSVALEGVGEEAGSETLDVDATQIIAYGDKVFVCAISDSGDPIGVYLIMSPDTQGRFKAPVQLAGGVFDLEESVEATSWTSYKVELDRPVLEAEPVIGYGWAQTDSTIPSGRVKVNDRYYTGLDSLTERMGEVGSSSVGLLLALVERDDNGSISWLQDDPQIEWQEYQPEGMYGRDAVIEYKVQYSFYGGQLSRTSKPVSVRWADDHVLADANDEFTSYCVGVMPVVPKNIAPVVKGVHIYRKIIESGNSELEADTEFKLISTVWLDSEVLDDENQDVGTGNFKRRNYQDWYAAWGDSGNPPSYTKNSPFSSWAWEDAYWRPPQFFRKISINNGTCYKTQGWVPYGASHMCYLAEHYGLTADIAIEDSGNTYIPSGQYVNFESFKVTVNATAFTRFNGSAGFVNSLVRAGADFPSFTVYDASADEYYTMWHRFEPGNSDVREDPTSGDSTLLNSGAGFPTDAIAAISYQGAPTLELTDAPAGYTTGYANMGSSKIPYIAHRDVGAETPDTETSFVGGEDEDFIDVQPVAIGIAGGRLLGLGGMQDGNHRPSRFWYSIFQRFGMVLEGSYLDYGARDDGAAVAVSAYRGRVLIHFSSATYVVDVSGGSDMSWRELGANTGVGLLNREAVVGTPIGNIWCDKNGVYLYDGRAINEITRFERTGVSMRDTYRRLIAGNFDNVKAHYRPDLKQAWVCVGKSVLVFDITSAAWHEHELDEVVTDLSGSFEIQTIFDLDGETIFVLKDSNGTSRFFKAGGDESEASFEWGIDIEMDAGAPEIIKKSKRLYIDAMSNSAGSHLTVDVQAQGGGIITQDLDIAQVSDFTDPDKDTVVRFSASARGRKLLISAKKKAGETWTGAIESLGMSHKVKRVK